MDRLDVSGSVNTPANLNNVENETNSAHAEEIEIGSLKPTYGSISEIDKEESRVPPLAKPENDEEDVGRPAAIGIEDDDHHNLDHHSLLYPDRDGDVVDLSDRAGTFPYAPGFSPTALNGNLTNPNGEIIPDVNLYQHKKTVAQGMMDLALFSANANQLRYVLESSNHTFYYPGLVLISLSLIFQIAVGVGLLWNTRYNVKDEKEICLANKVNNFTVVGIFLVTVINVFISAFGTTAGTSVAAAPVSTAPAT